MLDAILISAAATALSTVSLDLMDVAARVDAGQGMVLCSTEVHRTMTWLAATLEGA